MKHTSTRRNFLTTSAAASAMLSTAPVWATHAKATTPAIERTISLTTGLPLRITSNPQGGFVVASVQAGKGLVQYLSMEGTVRLEKSFSRPVRALAFDRQGRLLVGMGAEIQQLSSQDLSLEQRFTFPAKSLITGIVDTEASLVAIDSSHQKLWKIDREEKSVLELMKLSSVKIPAEFFHIRANQSGQILVGNPSRHRIESFSGDGTPLSRFGQKSRTLAGFSGCCNPVSFVVRADGSVVTAEQGIPRIKLYSAEGKFEKMILGPAAFEQTITREKMSRSSECENRGFDLALMGTEQLAVLDRTMANVHFVNV